MAVPSIRTVPSPPPEVSAKPPPSGWAEKASISAAGSPRGGAPAASASACRAPCATVAISVCNQAHSGRGREVVGEDAGIDRLQRVDVGDLHPLVDLVHAGADEADLDHRAMVLDEARVGGASGGR